MAVNVAGSVEMADAHRTVVAPVCPASSLLQPLPITAVTLTDGFWAERQTLATDAILPHALEWMEKLGWIQNFIDAASGEQFTHRGREFADSEIYKLMEAMAWDQARVGEPIHAENLDRLIGIIEDAQEPDGYIHTLFGRAWQAPRYSNMEWGHELYCHGHLIQAAIAHFRATGSTRFLEVATKLADHICGMFGPDGYNRICGHPEIEVALAELARATDEKRYMDQASVFVERRGTGVLKLHEFGREYWQDATPVRSTEVLHGHAVRALYLAAGAADVAVDTEDAELLDALKVQWDRTVSRRTYINGGMGSHHMDEAFGSDFVLPPDRSYCETCAGVASAMFSWRLLLQTGDARYADLIERTWFNIIATAPSKDGNAFFYANTLHQREKHSEPARNEDGVTIRGGSAGRQAWFEVSCCPTNLARTLASLGSYTVTASDAGVQIHQFASAIVEAGSVSLAIDTAYPASGEVTVTVTKADSPTDVSLRVPAWANGAQLTLADGTVVDAVPGTYVTAPSVAEGETVVLHLPIELRMTTPDSRIDAIRGTVAFERGPEVLALESVDLPEGWELDDVRVEGLADAHSRVRVVKVERPEALWPYAGDTREVIVERAEVELVEYHSWAERGPSTMRVWIPTV